MAKTNKVNLKKPNDTPKEVPRQVDDQKKRESCKKEEKQKKR